MKSIYKISMLVLALSSMSIQAEIPVLAIDELGNETTTMISDSDYQKVTTLEADSLAQVADDQLDMAFTTPHLTLKGIMVGLEAQTSVGPGPFKLGAAINQQFYFEIKK